MPSKSKKQQRFMGIVHGLQKGTIDPSKVSKEVKDVAFGKGGRKPINVKSAKDFAETKHKGLPEKIKKENMITNFNRFLNESNYDKLAELLMRAEDVLGYEVIDPQEAIDGLKNQMEANPVDDETRRLIFEIENIDKNIDDFEDIETEPSSQDNNELYEPEEKEYEFPEDELITQDED